MSKRVLSVGQCGFDNQALTHFLTKHFDVELRTSDLAADTISTLQSNEFDLILINRKLDRDYSDGMDILKQLKSDPQHENIPVMLVSNFEDAQATAMDSGALLGFGKSQYGDPAVLERLRAVLD